MPGDNPKCKTGDVTITARRRTRNPGVYVSCSCSRVEKPGGNRIVFGGKNRKGDGAPGAGPAERYVPRLLRQFLPQMSSGASLQGLG